MTYAFSVFRSALAMASKFSTMVLPLASGLMIWALEACVHLRNCSRGCPSFGWR